MAVRQQIGAKRGAKTFQFDRAFGQYATQAEVFDSAVQPIIDETLMGFNCTVFAYGQTGTVRAKLVPLHSLANLDAS